MDLSLHLKKKENKDLSAFGLKYNYVKCNWNSKGVGAKRSTMSAGLTEASAIERNAVQVNGFASSLHLQELFSHDGFLYEC